MKKNGLKHTAAQGLTIVLALVLMLALMPVMSEKAMADDGIDDAATSFTMNDCTYTILDTDNPSVRLDTYLGSDSELTIPQTVTHEGITYTVVKIGLLGSYESPLVRVELPDTVTELSSGSFSNLARLQTVILSKRITKIPAYCFLSCHALKTVKNMNQVTSIGAEAFSDTGFTSFTLPANLTKLKSNVFADCAKLKTVTLSRKMKSIDTSAFSFSGIRTFKVKRGSKYFAADKYLLYNKKKTRIIAYAPGRTNRSYTVPGNVTSIGKNAFKYNTHLKKVIIRKNVRTIGTGAFEGSSITSVTLTGKTRLIGSHAFEHCYKLKSVSLGKKVHTIQTCAFVTDSLKSVRIPRNVKKIGKRAFGYYWYDGLDEEDLTIVPMIGKKTGFRIYGKKGSAAHKYAKANGFKFVKY
ncbi:MAG: leucine-rich repeat domain-containing protein [Eubacterium sp.]|jgi:hypothetical protein